MYKSFRVKNFRCFKDLQINDLGRVNLIAGKNNTGKTALLEAMYILTANDLTRQDAATIRSASRHEALDIPSEELGSCSVLEADSIFYDFDMDSSLRNMRIKSTDSRVKSTPKVGMVNHGARLARVAADTFDLSTIKSSRWFYSDAIWYS